MGKLVAASVGTIVGLYGVLLLLLIIIFELCGIGLDYLIITASIVLLLDFLLAPIFMDISLRWFYKIKWRSKEEIPQYVVDFIQKICTEKNIKFPKFGIIDDNAPNAFTYGRTPNSARIVVTKGTILMLSEDELKAVIGHEMGHVVHWDMLLMTVLQLVPVITYSIAKTLMRYAKTKRRSSGNNKSLSPQDIALIIAIISYIVYIVSEYIILWFSRIREYYADNYAARVTGNPNYLTSALVKIGYGLKATKEDSKTQTISALGISDDKASKVLAVAADRKSGVFNIQTLKNITRWDLWNPWATIYEINSTHPLIAKRLKKLSKQAEQMNIRPIIAFDEAKPESYVDDFIKEIFIMFMPWIVLVGGVLINVFALGNEIVSKSTILVFILAALASVLKTLYRYPTKLFEPKEVSTVLEEVKVSAIKPVPCTLSGKLIGKGNPGYMFSEDFILEDETGIIYLDYSQPLNIWNGLFGLLRANKYIDKEVEVKGWYRRAPIPYIEIKEMDVDGKKIKCYSYITQIVFSIVLTIGLCVWFFI